MQSIGLILLAMASLVACDRIIDNGAILEESFFDSLTDIPIELGGGSALTQDELLRQKFILDIVYKIYAPLEEDLLKLGDCRLVCNENVYMRPFTQDMQMVLNLICNKQMLNRVDDFRFNNEHHTQQAIGLYRLLVAAHDFETFKSLAVYGRLNINTEMFVYCLVLALGQREDTKMLTVPALYEILTQLYVTDKVIDRVRSLNTAIDFNTPQLKIDVGQGGTKMNNLRIYPYSSGSLSQDMSLKSYVTMLINELLLNQNTVRNSVVGVDTRRARAIDDEIMRNLEENFGQLPTNNANEKSPVESFESNFGTALARHNTDFQKGKTSTQTYRSDLRERYMGIGNGKILLYTLQQLVALLNIERIALGQSLLPTVYPSEKMQLNYNANVPAFMTIEKIITNISRALNERIRNNSDLSYNHKVNEISLMLANNTQDLGLVDVLGQVAEEINKRLRKSLIANLLENEAALTLLSSIVNVVELKLTAQHSQRDEFISTVTGVTINNVKVDELRTYEEERDVDFTNLLNINYSDKRYNKGVVAFVRHLNHKSFDIDIDVTSDRQQQVVLRNLLVPKVDGKDNLLQMHERRKNVIILDVSRVELQQGRNTLKVRSKNITTTSRDTTPLTKIHQLVMQALNGKITLHQNQLAGQTTLLPHHLLLPRGRTNGLPMQLITVITPIGSYVDASNGQERSVLNTLLRDNLPLNYPLHSDIIDLNKEISMPNLMIKDVKIYHDDIFPRIYSL